MRKGIKEGEREMREDGAAACLKARVKHLYFSLFVKRVWVSPTQTLFFGF